MAKKKAKPTSALAGVPTDLANQVQSIRAIAQAHSLLQEGCFPHPKQPAVGATLNWLGALHKHAMDQAVKHPCARLVPELAAVVKEAQNGKTA